MLELLSLLGKTVVVTDDGGSALFGGVFLVIWFLFFAAFYVLSAWLLWRIGKRLGYDKCWMAWVPLANIWMICEMGEKDQSFCIWAVILSFCCGIIGMIMAAIAFMRVAERCGKESWWGILYIIPIANLVMMYILGTGDAVPPAGPQQYYQQQPPQGYAPPPQGYAPPPPPAQTPPPPPAQTPPPPPPPPPPAGS